MVKGGARRGVDTYGEVPASPVGSGGVSSTIEGGDGISPLQTAIDPVMA